MNCVCVCVCFEFIDTAKRNPTCKCACVIVCAAFHLLNMHHQCEPEICLKLHTENHFNAKLRLKKFDFEFGKKTPQKPKIVCFTY